MKVKMTYEIVVPFEDYEKKKLNKKAIAYLKSYVNEALKNVLDDLPIYVEDESGAYIEDATQKVKIKRLSVQVEQD